ncbi:MAG: hypothetical protein M3N10_06365 [Actinomycetota bacterium]|nr:hypothetical protein [Actinomycetota bacterium]
MSMYTANVTAPIRASAFPRNAADPTDSSCAITAVPARAIRMPAKDIGEVLSPNRRYAITATKTGWVVTSTTLAATLV